MNKCAIRFILAIAGNSSVEECKLFSDEINVMKKVSDGYSNPHVLQMIGCVTVTFPMMLLLQYLPNGSLKDYLRSSQFAASVRGLHALSVACIMWYNKVHPTYFNYLFSEAVCKLMETLVSNLHNIHLINI